MFTATFWKNVAEDAATAAAAAVLPVVLAVNGNLDPIHILHVAAAAAFVVVLKAFTAGRGNTDSARFNKGGDTEDGE